MASDVPVARSLMNSIGQDCTDLKKAYEDCFNSWFSEKFLHGSREDSCASLFAVYQSCVKQAIQERKIGMSFTLMSSNR